MVDLNKDKKDQFNDLPKLGINQTFMKKNI